MLLFSCHATNEAAQLVQGYRFLKYENSEESKREKSEEELLKKP